MVCAEKLDPMNGRARHDKMRCSVQGLRGRTEGKGRGEWRRTRSQLATGGDHDLLAAFSRVGADLLHGLDDVHAAGYGAEHDVLAVEPVSLDGAEEELGSVGVGPGVGHRQCSRPFVLELEVLVGELLAVNGLAARAVALGEVAALAHEVFDDAVEAGAREAEALLAGAQSTEVLGGLGDDVFAQGHLDAARGSSTNGHIKKNLNHLK